jgi:hypothetical protein
MLTIHQIHFCYHFSPIVGCYGFMAKKKIEPNTVIKFIGFLFFSNMCSTILGFFADTEGLTSLNVLLWRI